MLIESQPDLEVAGEAGDGRAALHLAEIARPDVMLMDVRMPIMDGIASTLAILEAADAAGRSAPRIIVLTTFDLDEGAASALRKGASGFLLKDTQPAFLLAAIRTVHAGNAVIAPGATNALFAHFGARAAPPAVPHEFHSLTTRERGIFSFAARGMSNSEIAAQEYLSEATVKTHISRVLGKLSLRDRVQLVIFAYEHGLNTGDHPRG
jgi:DNA-binding NarL/FixJ family response regulator